LPLPGFLESSQVKANELGLIIADIDDEPFIQGRFGMLPNLSCITL